MEDLELKYHVLSPFSRDEIHAVASRAAIRTYANFIEAMIPESNVPQQLRKWIGDLEVKNENI